MQITLAYKDCAMWEFYIMRATLLTLLQVGHVKRLQRLIFLIMLVIVKRKNGNLWKGREEKTNRERFKYIKIYLFIYLLK